MNKLFGIMTMACAVSMVPSQASSVCTSGKYSTNPYPYSQGQNPRTQNSQRGNWQENSSSRYVPRDEEILLNVRHALSDRSLTPDGDNIHVTVDNGVVYLRGEVDGEGEKQDIADAVRDIRGVKNVKMELRTSSNNEDNNQSYRNEQSYRVNPYSDNNLAYEEDYEEIIVSEPEQKPYGTQQQKFGNQPSHMNKMQNDQNRQQATTNAKNPMMSDKEIKEKILDKLTNTWIRKKYEGIQVDVRNQQVTLKGAVDSQSDITEIENRIHQIPEVKSINNEIKIKPMTSQPRS